MLYSYILKKSLINSLIFSLFISFFLTTLATQSAFSMIEDIDIRKISPQNKFPNLIKHKIANYMPDDTLLWMKRCIIKTKNEGKEQNIEFSSTQKAVAKALYNRAGERRRFSDFGSFPGNKDIYFLRAAADLDDPNALYLMSTEKAYCKYLDIEVRYQYLKKAEELGNNHAKHFFAKHHMEDCKDEWGPKISKDFNKATEYFKILINNKYLPSIAYMARLYTTGTPEIRKNYQVARDLWEKAYSMRLNYIEDDPIFGSDYFHKINLEQNINDSRLNLIDFYRDGYGGFPNTEKWIELLEDNVEHNSSSLESFVTLAWLYINGTETTQNLIKAEELLNNMNLSSFTSRSSSLKTTDFAYFTKNNEANHIDFEETKNKLLILLKKKKYEKMEEKNKKEEMEKK